MRLVLAGLRDELTAIITLLGPELVKSLRFVGGSSEALPHYKAGDVRIVPLSYQRDVAEDLTAAAFKRWKRADEVFIVSTGMWMTKLRTPRAFEPRTLIIDDQKVKLGGRGTVLDIDNLPYEKEVKDIKAQYPRLTALAHWPGSTAASVWLRSGCPGKLRYFVAPVTKAGGGIPENHLRRHQEACLSLGHIVSLRLSEA